MFSNEVNSSLNKTFRIVGLFVFILTFQIGFSQFSIKNQVAIHSYIHRSGDDAIYRVFDVDVIRRFNTMRTSPGAEVVAQGHLYSKTTMSGSNLSAKGHLESLGKMNCKPRSVFMEAQSSLQTTYIVNVPSFGADIWVQGKTQLTRDTPNALPGDIWGTFISIVEIDEEGEVIEYVADLLRRENRDDPRPENFFETYRIIQPGRYAIRINTLVRAAQANHRDPWSVHFKANCTYELGVITYP